MKNYTVSEFTKSIKGLIEGTFSETMAITGEVSNFSKASSGHMYFILKDGNSQLRCAFFKRYAMGAGVFIPKNGDKIQAIGDITLYEADGSYQLLVKRVMYDSAGDFWRKFEETKRKLESEGLFDELRKRSLPLYPFRIALITSATGAAVKDFIVTSHGGKGKFHMDVWAVPVQGAEAAVKIAAAINRAGQLTDRYDTVVVMRGGGSLEDLAVFNEEIVVRAIAASKVVTISAIGHERDITVSDLAADFRAATPTGAAVALCQGYSKALDSVLNFEERITGSVINKIKTCYQRLDYIELRLDKSSPSAIMVSYNNRIGMALRGMEFAVRGRLNKLKNRQERLESAIGYFNPQRAVETLKLKINNYDKNIKNIMVSELSSYKRKLTIAEDKLNILNPENVLGRGYALVYKEGKVVTSVDKVEIKENIEIKMKDGYINSFVIGKKSEAIDGQNTHNS